jgi:hypothetical protein
MNPSSLIVRQTFDAAALVATHPPQFRNANKKLVHSLACSADTPPEGAIEYSRWRAMPLPDHVPAAATALEMREDVFGYEAAEPGSVEWYMNFADPFLFVAYGGPLLAQDELQVLEHPLLGSLLEALRASTDPRLAPVTVEHGASTPVLVRGVERRCALATDPDVLEGRPNGLYGNRFARANHDAIRGALRVLTPPTRSNILAMAAPPGGSGAYEEAEIRSILVTAFTGFTAARLEGQGAGRTVIHTGHWGTGAFGGNKVLMAVLQIVAARLAALDRLVYHTVEAEGSEPYREAVRVVERLVPGGTRVAVDEVVSAVQALGFVWGFSDGN